MGYYCCGIYDERPESCRRYPEPGSYVPPTCTFYFADGQRKGACSPECNASCCMLPRAGGEPGGAAMPEIAGGLPCQHLIYVGQHPAVSGIRETDTEPGGDRGEDQPVTDPVELVLAEKRRREGGGSGPL
jgi:hypothetical protein